MKSSIFEGIAERLAEIKRAEGRGVEPKAIDDPVSYCSVYGHEIGHSASWCVRCGRKPL